MMIFGYGAVGRETAALLAGRGDKAVIAQRKSPGCLPDNCEFVATNVLERAATVTVSSGADTIICCLGFPYDSRIWADAWPRAMANLLEAAASASARFVFADNLYMYGPQDQPLTEDLPLSGFGRKPRIRAEITRLWQEAHASGKVQAVAIRASDFYGPAVETSVLSVYGVRRLLTGKSALIPYSPDHPHDFTYVPDFARALLTLADAPLDAYGQAWHVPNAPTRTLRSLIEQTACMIGVPPQLTILPGLLRRIGGLFNRQLYELQEMRFQTDRPYLVDTSKFAHRFWDNPTSFESGLATTVAYYRPLF
jgi:nucleoside-diphosphate-sugar epimerase